MTIFVTPNQNRPTPVGAVAGWRAYSVPQPEAPIDLHLDGNEGPLCDESMLKALASIDRERLRRYPDKRPLEARIAERFGVEGREVLVTAGGDDAIDRACRAMLAPVRELILPVPTFVMISRDARLCGATVREVEWPQGPYPVEEVIDSVTERTAMIAVVSPNNPTGAVATPEDLMRLSEAAPQALLLVDLAYTEFADVDLTDAALALPNAVVVRTFSKAYGLAGLRLGYAIGEANIIDWLRAAGGPYPASSVSLALGEAVLERDDLPEAAYLARIRREREQLRGLLEGLGAAALPSQGNFVLARFDDAGAVRDRLAARGIAVRAFPDDTRLADALRITCPGDDQAFTRLRTAFVEAIPPAAPEDKR